MKTKSKLPPKYRLHRPRNCAVVTINGRNHYLGPFGSPESHEKYARLIAEWRAGQPALSSPLSKQAPTRGFAAPDSITVNELILAFWRHAQSYYLKNGKLTKEASNIREALRLVRKLYGSSPGGEFGPRQLKAVIQAMIEHGYSRGTTNRHLSRIKRMIKWGIENELLPSGCFERIQVVPGLRKGRSAAKELPPVMPVTQADIDAIMPHVGDQIAAMVRIQALTGMRPGEVVLMRTCDIDRSGDVWSYVPESHKTEHYGRERVIFIGPKAQLVLRPWLRDDPEQYLFSPKDVMQKMGCKGNNPGEKYSVCTYYHAIRRGCARAKIAPWSPNRLRHTAATEIRKRFGLEAAQTVLGQSEAKVTQIYAERDQGLARKVMLETG